METPSLLKRQTAYKVWIKDIHTAESRIAEDSGFPFFLVAGKRVSRVNIIGSVIDVFFSGAYGSLVLDDGSGQIRLKVWGEDLFLVEEKNVGDFVLVVGRIAVFDEEQYLRPEIARLVHQDWALLRRLELVKEYGLPGKQEKVVLEKELQSAPEVEPSLAAREMILHVIDKEGEVSEETLSRMQSLPREKVQVALYDLLKEGEIFSPRKGVYRLV